MLQTQTVEPHTFSILKELMGFEPLQGFQLVGGTALSLMYGHRISVDLDLFSHIKFDADILKQLLMDHFGQRIQFENQPNFFGLFAYIDGVKIDIVKFPHPLLKPSIEIEDIRMYSPEDIVAMKCQAILGRGRKKDFWDIAELLNHFPVEDFAKLHEEKYKGQYLLISIPQAMIYFDDADESDDPVCLKGLKWQDVKSIISQKVRDYLS